MATESFETTCATCTHLYASVFSETAPETIEKISQVRHCRTYPRKHVLFWEGEMPVNLYCIHRGKVKLYKTGPEGSIQIVRIAGEGDLLGYRSFLSQEPYRATASTLEETEVCVIPGSVFQQLLSRDPKLARRLMERLARDLGKAETHLYELAQQPVRVRVAEILLELQEEFGDNEEGFLNIQLSREDIAGMTGVAPETISRVLSEFSQHGLIEVHRRRIRLLHPDALRKLTQVC